MRAEAAGRFAERDARMLDAGQRLDALDDLWVIAVVVTRLVPARMWRGIRDEDVARLQSRRHRENLLQTSHEQTGVGEKDQCQADLHGHQCFPGAPGA